MSLSPNFNERPLGSAIDMLVLHYTGMPTGAEAYARLCDPDAAVSAHYLIDEDGAVHDLVPEQNRAWHAGVASWQGADDINDRSIGIELVNPGHEFGYVAFPEPQMLALIKLCQSILSRHAILAKNVVGHSDVAPKRKQDPGELFDWQRLAGHGIGVWPDQGGDSDDSDGDIAEMLTQYGYEIEDLSATITAFQRHFRPHNIDGLAGPETLALLRGLLDQA